MTPVVSAVFPPGGSGRPGVLAPGFVGPGLPAGLCGSEAASGTRVAGSKLEKEQFLPDVEEGERGLCLG